ncbi:coiled-coil domain-containing protein 87-like isoform X2 [Glandiceps talaboti]
MATIRRSINELKGIQVLPDPKLNKNNEMYPISNLPYGARDIQERYDSILGPLTLFAPFTHEEKYIESDMTVPDQHELDIERPITPIDESIKAPPSMLSELSNLVRRRITADPETEHLSVEDQQALAGIVMGEVNGIWPDIRRQVDDPFLTPEQNKELQRRITVHIVTVCEQLFHHYIAKAQILNKRGVFSGPSNMSRLKAQLALDSSKFLNILAIRRHIVADLRGQIPSSGDDSSDDERGKTASSAAAPLSYKRLIEISRPKKKKKGVFKIHREIRDLERQMPYLETEKVFEYLPDIRQFERDDEFEEEAVTPVTDLDEKSYSRQSSTKDSFHLSGKLAKVTKPDIKLKKSNSLPNLADHETLAEEFGLDDDDDTASVKSSYHPDILSRRYSQEDLKKSEEKKKVEEEKGRPDTRQKLQQDLMKLSQYKSQKDSKEERLDEEEDLPPLLQALSKHGRIEGRKEMLQQQLKELQEKEAKEKAEQTIKIREPTHPQPAIITKKMPNKSVVRTSDVRVSERVSLSSVTLDLYTTVYNELVGDVDSQTIKKLDQNLFFGQEINEVYDEIMKILPNDHFRHDQDDLIEPSADHVNLSVLLSSSALGKSKKDRIMNPELKRNVQPPWGDENVSQWAKSPLFNADQLAKQKAMGMQTPASGMMTFQEYPASVGGGTGNYGMGGGASSYGGGETYGAAASSYGGAMSGNMMDLESSGPAPGMIDDRNSRAYASWLNWWKSTVNSDDYMKYLSTQENDYLGVVFHFYDSGDSDSDDEKGSKAGPSLAKQKKMKERQEKVNVMKQEKTAFTPGTWNVNSILMGGLGKDPEVEIEEDEEVVTPRSVRSKRSRAVSRARTDRSHTPTAMSRKSSEGKILGDSLNVKDIDTKSTAGSTSRAPTSQSRYTSGSGSKPSTRRASRISKASESTSAKSHGGTSKASEPLTSQERLEKIWSSLQMPDRLKLDMAIKYSSDQYIDQLEECIEAWEKATGVILHREALISKLEAFERMASDPDRFFQKGYRGSSVARLDEARQRSHLYSALDEIDKKVKKKVQGVKDKFKDEMTFQGRPYLEKVKFDRTEMLYWLQQERRQQAIDRAVLAQEMPLKMAELPPLQTIS